MNMQPMMTALLEGPELVWKTRHQVYNPKELSYEIFKISKDSFQDPNSSLQKKIQLNFLSAAVVVAPAQGD